MKFTQRYTSKRPFRYQIYVCVNMNIELKLTIIVFNIFLIILFFFLLPILDNELKELFIIKSFPFNGNGILHVFNNLKTPFPKIFFSCKFSHEKQVWYLKINYIQYCDIFESVNYGVIVFIIYRNIFYNKQANIIIKINK